MRRVAMVAVALVLALGVPVQGQDDEDKLSAATFLMGLLTVSDTIIAEVPDDAIQAKYAVAEDQLLELLLATEMAECYRDSYATAWRMYADLYRLRQADNVYEVELLSAYLQDDIGHLMDGYACS